MECCLCFDDYHTFLNLARLITMFVSHFLNFLVKRQAVTQVFSNLWFCDDCDKNWGDMLFPLFISDWNQSHNLFLKAISSKFKCTPQPCFRGFHFCTPTHRWNHPLLSPSLNTELVYLDFEESFTVFSSGGWFSLVSPFWA